MAYQEETKYRIEEVNGGDWGNEICVKVVGDSLGIKNITVKQGSEIVVFHQDQVYDLIRIIQSLG